MLSKVETITHPLLNDTMDIWDYESCTAEIAEFDDSATLYTIISGEVNRGHATQLLRDAQKYYKDKGKALNGSLALHHVMRHIYHKLGIKELTC